MSKNLSNTLFSRFALLILVFALFHPSVIALASDKEDKDKTEVAEKKSSNATTATSTDLANILIRIERAEAEAKAAREAADAANNRATQLEKELEQTRQRLQETDSALKQFKSESNFLATNKTTHPLAKIAKTTPQNEGDNSQDQEQASEEPEEELSLNTINDRLLEIKDMVDVHDTRLKNASRVTVETGEGFNVKLHGTLLFNTYYNSAGTDDPPTGLYLLGGNNISLENGANFGATIRQTQLGFSFFAPQIGKWRLSGDLQLDFFGGNPPVYNGRAFSPLRLRIARAKLESGRFAFIVGQDDPIISPLNPTSIAQVGFPALAESGNLWSWTPQAKVAYRLISRENERLTIEGGILAPYNGQTNTEFQFETRPDAGERSRMPAFETRVSYTRGDLESIPSNAYLAFDAQPFQVGVGVHYGRHLAVPPRDGIRGTTINAVAVSGDYVIPITSKMTLTGEVFWGRSLGGLGGGIVQGIVFPFYGSRAIGVRSIGGWSQLQIRPRNNVAIHLAYGLDDPYSEDLVDTRFDLAAGVSRAANRTFSGNILYRFRSNFIISTEYRFMQTYFSNDQSAPTRPIPVIERNKVNNHINVGFAYSF